MQHQTAVRVVVHGRVQGVGYRAWARDEAARQGLAGWVRNDPSGTVTALLAGPRDAVDRMLEAMLHGPAHAVVTSLATETAEPREAPARFEVRR
ncbi:MAG: acylphosphatase [Amaricoccus sp.]